MLHSQLLSQPQHARVTRSRLLRPNLACIQLRRQSCSDASNTHNNSKRWHHHVAFSSSPSSVATPPPADSPTNTITQQPADAQQQQEASNSIAEQQNHTLYRTPKCTWRVRPFKPSDASAASALQTDAFHESNPIQLVDNLAYRFFYAEVVDAMNKKIKQLDEESFVMFVAEDLDNEKSSSKQVVGIVEVSLSKDKEVAKRVDSSGLSVYIASMAVRPSHRRRGVASSLLAAAEQQARAWGQSNLALQVFADNDSAIRLYTSAGFVEVHRDPMLRRLLGERIRVTMMRQLQLEGV